MSLEVLEEWFGAVLLVGSPVLRDDRGFFYEVWRGEALRAMGIPPFVQGNHSRSRRGVLRGLHWQGAPTPQGKLVRCASGRVHDVVVDLRGGSPTFGRHRGIDLEAPDLRAPAGAAALQRLLWIPPGFAHGFVVLSEEADVLYEVTAPWDPRGEGTLAWDDRDLGIEWPAREPAVSKRDGAGVALASLRGAPPFRWEGKP